jgi:hypothetical protein
MAGRRQSEIEIIQGRLTLIQALWDYERERILRALGFDDDINPRAWSTEALVEEIKDCVQGGKGCQSLRGKKKTAPRAAGF